MNRKFALAACATLFFSFSVVTSWAQTSASTSAATASSGSLSQADNMSLSVWAKSVVTMPDAKAVEASFNLGSTDGIPANLLTGVSAKGYARQVSVGGQNVDQVLITSVAKGDQQEAIAGTGLSAQFDADANGLTPQKTITVQGSKAALIAALQKLQAAGNQQASSPATVTGTDPNYTPTTGGSSNPLASQYQSPTAPNNTSAPTPSTNNATYSMAACPIRVDMTQMAAIGQSQVLNNGQPSTACSDTSARYPLMKDYTACPATISGTTSTLAYKLYYNTGSGSNIYVTDCTGDPSTTQQMVKSYSGCPISASSTAAYQQFVYTYVNSAGALTAYGSCQPDTSMPVPLNRNYSACSPVVDQAAGTVTKAYQQTYTDTTGATQNLGSCTPDSSTTTAMQKVYSGCGIMIDPSSGLPRLQYQYGYVNSSGAQTTVGSCQEDTSPAGLVATVKDYSKCPVVVNATGTQVNGAYKTAYTDPSSGQLIDIGGCTTDPSNVIPVARDYSSCPPSINQSTATVNPEYQNYYLNSTGQAVYIGICTVDTSQKLPVQESAAGCPDVVNLNTLTANPGYKRYFVNTSVNPAQTVTLDATCQTDTTTNFAITETPTGCTMDVNLTALTAVQQTEWVYTNASNAQVVVKQCADAANPPPYPQPPANGAAADQYATVFPITSTTVGCPPRLDVNNALAYQQVQLTYTTSDGVVHVAKSCSDSGVTYPMVKDYSQCSAIVTGTTETPQFKYQITDSTGVQTYVSACAPDAGASQALQKTGYGCEGLFTNNMSSQTSYGWTRWYYFSATNGAPVYVTQCASDAGVTYQQQVRVASYINDDTTLSALPVEQVYIMAPSSFPAPGVAGSQGPASEVDIGSPAVQPGAQPIPYVLTQSGISSGSFDPTQCTSNSATTSQLSNVYERPDGTTMTVSSGPGKPSICEVFTGSTTLVNVLSQATALGWDGVSPANIGVVVQSGAVIGATNSTYTSLAIPSGFPSGTTISLINKGYIVGAGGNAGRGTGGGSNGYNAGGVPTSGGTAIGVSFATNIANNGTIGSGGGGGTSGTRTGGGSYDCSGSGGGGAGYIAGVSFYADIGVGQGAPGTLTTGGAGSNYHAGNATAGYAGGDLGQPGAGPAPGAAGYAITGISLVTWTSQGTLLGPTQ